MSDPVCIGNKKNCPYKIFDVKKNSIICTFYEKYWDNFHSYGFDEANRNLLIKKACKKIKTYELHQIYTSKLHTKKTILMLKDIVIGDILFWVSRNEVVILIEKPSEITSLVRCNCQRHNGEKVNIPAHLLRQLSKGDFIGEYTVDNYENNKWKAKELEYWAKYHGFRAEIEERDDSYILRIYGASQNEVNDFISLFIIQNRRIG